MKHFETCLSNGVVYYRKKNESAAKQQNQSRKIRRQLFADERRFLTSTPKSHKEGIEATASDKETLAFVVLLLVSNTFEGAESMWNHLRIALLSAVVY